MTEPIDSTDWPNSGVPWLKRTLRDGACNEPQPWNWKDACRRKPGHSGDHHAFDGQRFPPEYVFAWPGPTGPVSHVSGLRGTSVYVR